MIVTWARRRRGPAAAALCAAMIAAAVRVAAADPCEEISAAAPSYARLEICFTHLLPQAVTTLMNEGEAPGPFARCAQPALHARKLGVELLERRRALAQSLTPQQAVDFLRAHNELTYARELLGSRDSIRSRSDRTIAQATAALNRAIRLFEAVGDDYGRQLARIERLRIACRCDPGDLDCWSRCAEECDERAAECTDPGMRLLRARALELRAHAVGRPHAKSADTSACGPDAEALFSEVLHLRSSADGTAALLDPFTGSRASTVRRVASQFGEARLPGQCSLPAIRGGHVGVDLVAPTGSDLHAATSGVVIAARDGRPSHHLANLVAVHDPVHDRTVVYRHIEQASLPSGVERGAWVRGGQLIARSWGAQHDDVGGAGHLCVELLAGRGLQSTSPLWDFLNPCAHGLHCEGEGRVRALPCDLASEERVRYVKEPRAGETESIGFCFVDDGLGPTGHSFPVGITEAALYVDQKRVDRIDFRRALTGWGGDVYADQVPYRRRNGSVANECGVGMLELEYRVPRAGEPFELQLMVWGAGGDAVEALRATLVAR